MYIVIEGPDCCGKTTQTRLLTEYLERKQHKVFLTKEPGSPHDSVCRKIRELLLDPSNNIMDRSAFFLFQADRAQHISTVKQKLQEGYVVVSDRSSLSTYVYHVASGEERAPELGTIIDYAQQISPDFCFICSADLEWSLNKLKKRKSLDRIELFNQEFHKTTHDLFDPNSIKQLANDMKTSPRNILYAPKASDNKAEDVHQWIVKQIEEEYEL